MFLVARARQPPVVIVIHTMPRRIPIAPTLLSLLYLPTQQLVTTIVGHLAAVERGDIEDIIKHVNNF